MEKQQKILKPDRDYMDNSPLPFKDNVMFKDAGYVCAKALLWRNYTLKHKKRLNLQKKTKAKEAKANVEEGIEQCKIMEEHMKTKFGIEKFFEWESFTSDLCDVFQIPVKVIRNIKY